MNAGGTGKRATGTTPRSKGQQGSASKNQQVQQFASMAAEGGNAADANRLTIARSSSQAQEVRKVDSQLSHSASRASVQEDRKALKTAVSFQPSGGENVSVLRLVKMGESSHRNLQNKARFETRSRQSSARQTGSQAAQQMTDQSVEDADPEASLGVGTAQLSQDSGGSLEREQYGLVNPMQVATDATEQDWIARHVNFLEDFSREGQHLKDDIRMKRDNVQQDSTERLTERFNKKILNTNISQVLGGSRLRFGRVRSRYQNNSDLHGTQYGRIS